MVVRNLPVWGALATLLFAAGCGTPPTSEPNSGRLDVPAWSEDVIWYQIFVERFRNGDPSNDPTRHDIVGVTDEAPPDGWRPTPWTQDWYRQEPWAAATGKDFYGTVQFRRYGGTSRACWTVSTTCRTSGSLRCTSTR